jgi:microcystin-dependent protein
MAYGGDVNAVENLTALLAMGWLPCIGQTLTKNNPTYKPLYDVIGEVFAVGHESDHVFSLPDLRGYFVQGAGGQTAIGTVLTNSMTGKPTNPFQTSPVGDHTHQVSGVPPDTQLIDVVLQVTLAESNPAPTASSIAGNHSHTILSGGDLESRPVNVNVDYIIRFM